MPNKSRIQLDLYCYRNCDSSWTFFRLKAFTFWHMFWQPAHASLIQGASWLPDPANGVRFFVADPVLSTDIHLFASLLAVYQYSRSLSEAEPTRGKENTRKDSFVRIVTCKNKSCGNLQRKDNTQSVGFWGNCSTQKIQEGPVAPDVVCDGSLGSHRSGFPEKL